MQGNVKNWYKQYKERHSLRSVDWLIDRLSRLSTIVVRLIDWLANLVSDSQLIDWLIDWWTTLTYRRTRARTRPNDYPPPQRYGCQRAVAIVHPESGVQISLPLPVEISGRLPCRRCRRICGPHWGIGYPTDGIRWHCISAVFPTTKEKKIPIQHSGMSWTKRPNLEKTFLPNKCRNGDPPPSLRNCLDACRCSASAGESRCRRSPTIVGPEKSEIPL